MELVETFAVLMLCGLAGIVAAVWSRQRRRPPPSREADVPRGFIVLGYILGAAAGGALGIAFGIVLTVLAPEGAPEELPAYAIGPGIIIGAFAGGYLGRSAGLRFAARREREAFDG